MGATADVEAAGEDAFCGDTAFGAQLHRLPEGEDAGANLFFGGFAVLCGGGLGAIDGDGRVFEESNLVGEEKVGDGEVVLLCSGEEIGSAAEWIGDGASAGEGLGGTLCFGDNEAAADGVEDFVGQDGSCFVEGCEAHAVGVRGDRGVGVHLVAAEVEVGGFGEGDGLATVEQQRAGGLDGGDLCFDGCGID